MFLWGDNSMNERLKPCPFCGGVAIIYKSKMGDYRVECYSCFAHTFFEDSKEKAADEWNRRVENE